MSRAFTASKDAPLGRIQPARIKVLVTGAAGNIGSYFAQATHSKYDLRLMVRQADESNDIKAWGEVVEGDLTDLERMRELCSDVDTVLHLAGNASPNATWSSLMEVNIAGTYNTMVAARAAGCRRVIFASSIHAVSGYPADVQVKPEEPVNPGDLYGVSKCFGEALGRYMAEKEGLSVIALRIGGFQPHESALKEELGMMDAWVSRRDLTQLIERCIDVDNVQWAVFHGLSDNRFKRLDISNARNLLGYTPEDDFTEINPLLKDLNLRDEVMDHSQIDDSQKSGIREELDHLAGRESAS